jgi:hypothetical protein
VLDDAIQNLIIDYAEGAEIDPRAGLSECQRASSFRMFTRLWKLVVLQQVIIRCNYRRSLDYEDAGDFFPAALESLTVVSPTEDILVILRNLQEAIGAGELAALREIIPLCRCSHGVSPETFDFPAANTLFGELAELGMVAKVEDEVVGSFAAQARASGSVWEGDWGEDQSWVQGLTATTRDWHEERQER